MMQAIECLRIEGIPRLAASSNPVLGTSTLSVGTIRGGSKVNIVPDFCEASVDIRIIPGMDPGFIVDLLQQRVPNIEIDLKRSEPLHTDPSHPIISHLESLGSKLVGAPWFCDAAVFASHGCPSPAQHDHTVFVCPLCKRGVTIVPDEDINATFSRHEATPECRGGRGEKRKRRCALHRQSTNPDDATAWWRSAVARRSGRRLVAFIPRWMRWIENAENTPLCRLISRTGNPVLLSLRISNSAVLPAA
jgi:hypothetical protein